MDLNERIDAAILRISRGQAPMRIPVDATDPDTVLADCAARIRELEAQLAQSRKAEGCAAELLDAATKWLMLALRSDARPYLASLRVGVPGADINSFRAYLRSRAAGGEASKEDGEEKDDDCAFCGGCGEQLHFGDWETCSVCKGTGQASKEDDDGD